MHWLFEKIHYVFNFFITYQIIHLFRFTHFYNYAIRYLTDQQLYYKVSYTKFHPLGWNLQHMPLWLNLRLRYKAHISNFTPVSRSVLELFSRTHRQTDRQIFWFTDLQFSFKDHIPNFISLPHCVFEFCSHRHRHNSKKIVLFF